ncbi:MAG: hypothetical protein ACTSUX_05450 [Promethearchaeota archaeon]
MRFDTFFESFKEVSRRFQYDYIYIDAFFLTIWIGMLIKNKKWHAILFGIFTGIIVYLIDAVFWWNLSAGKNYPTGTTIREYWIGGVKMPHPLGDYFWIKFGADFMMCFSYSMFAFCWLWIMFENFESKKIKETIKYTLIFFGSWLLIPFLSLLIPLNDTIVYTVRHMETQMTVWVINVIIGYSILILIYGTNLFKSKNIRVLFYVFLVGCLESFFMEFPLLIAGIRSLGFLFLIFEVFFLFNQGAPYLYILYDKVLPLISKKISSKKKIVEEILIPA